MLNEMQLNEGRNQMLSESNNSCILSGKLTKRFEFSHKVRGENFYSNIIRVKRLNGEIDEIPIIVSGKEINFSKCYKEVDFTLSGRMCIFYYNEGGKKHTKVYVLATSCKLQPEEMQDENEVFLEGSVCKKPIYRTTPRGKEISELFIEVKRPKGKNLYIPCIAWNIIALECAEYQVGDKIKLKGRFQSRNYLKRRPENPEIVDEKVTYEVSINEIERVF